MKIVVIGGTGLIGSKTIPILREGGHEVVAASPNTGVNSITGEGLVAALAQNGNCLRADQAGAPDDDDLHIRSPFCSRPQSDDCLSSLRIRITVKTHPCEKVANIY